MISQIVGLTGRGDWRVLPRHRPRAPPLLPLDHDLFDRLLLAVRVVEVLRSRGDDPSFQRLNRVVIVV